MPPALGRRHEDEDYSPPPEGRRERIEGTPATCPPSNEGGLQGGHRKSSPSLDSTGATPLKSPLGQGGTSPRATNFCKDSRILSHLQGVQGDVLWANMAHTFPGMPQCNLLHWLARKFLDTVIPFI